MKNLFFVLLAFVTISTFSACGDDDDGGAGVGNEFTYNGTTYDIPNGFITDFGENADGSYDFDVYLASSSVSTGGLFGLSGTGDYVYLDLNTNSAEGLVAGTYNYSSSRSEFTLVGGTGIFLDYNITTFSGTNVLANDGTVDISIDGNRTTLTFNLTLTDGNTVSGEWTGTLEAF